MFILFTTDNKTYFESAEEFVTTLRTLDGKLWSFWRIVLEWKTVLSVAKNA